jgi:hypothetical protein
MIAWLWFATGWASAGAALALLLVSPSLALVGWWHPLVPPFVHALTLGVILSGHYAAQAARWRAATLTRLGLAAFLLPSLIWAAHASGTGLLLWGLGGGLPEGSAEAATWGGHYLIPTAIVLSLGAEAWRHLRERRAGREARPAAGSPVGLARHLPGLGLLVAMPLGVMLLMDRATGRYGFYGPPQIALHALAAAFLFVLPSQALAEAQDEPPARGSGASSRRILLAALALFALALDERAFGAGFAGGMPLGLALLAAVALWQGVPAPQRWGAEHELALRRLPWALFGLMLLHLALSAWRGIGEGEAIPLAARAGAWFLLGVAAPEALLRMTAGAGAKAAAVTGAKRLPLFALWAGALAVLAGQAAEAELAVRGGALLWLLGWLGIAGWAFAGRTFGRGA